MSDLHLLEQRLLVINSPTWPGLIVFSTLAPFSRVSWLEAINDFKFWAKQTAKLHPININIDTLVGHISRPHRRGQLDRPMSSPYSYYWRPGGARWAGQTSSGGKSSRDDERRTTNTSQIQVLHHYEHPGGQDRAASSRSTGGGGGGGLERARYTSNYDEEPHREENDDAEYNSMSTILEVESEHTATSTATTTKSDSLSSLDNAAGLADQTALDETSNHDTLPEDRFGGTLTALAAQIQRLQRAQLERRQPPATSTADLADDRRPPRETQRVSVRPDRQPAPANKQISRQMAGRQQEVSKEGAQADVHRPKLMIIKINADERRDDTHVASGNDDPRGSKNIFEVANKSTSTSWRPAISDLDLIDRLIERHLTEKCDKSVQVAVESSEAATGTETATTNRERSTQTKATRAHLSKRLPPLHAAADGALDKRKSLTSQDLSAIDGRPSSGANFKTEVRVMVEFGDLLRRQRSELVSESQLVDGKLTKRTEVSTCKQVKKTDETTATTSLKEPPDDWQQVSKSSVCNEIETDTRTQRQPKDDSTAEPGSSSTGRLDNITLSSNAKIRNHQAGETPDAEQVEKSAIELCSRAARRYVTGERLLVESGASFDERQPEEVHLNGVKLVDGQVRESTTIKPGQGVRKTRATGTTSPGGFVSRRQEEVSVNVAPKEKVPPARPPPPSRSPPPPTPPPPPPPPPPVQANRFNFMGRKWNSFASLLGTRHASSSPGEPAKKSPSGGRQTKPATPINNHSGDDSESSGFLSGLTSRAGTTPTSKSPSSPAPATGGVQRRPTRPVKLATLDDELEDSLTFVDDDDDDAEQDKQLIEQLGGQQHRKWADRRRQQQQLDKK